MAQNSSSQGGVAFDLNSQAGVLEVLTTIRKSDLPNDVRSELRDLVFLFANGGGDKAVREMLEQRLTEVGLTAPIAGGAKPADDAVAVAPEAASAPEPKPQGGFAGGRPTPSFGANPKPTPVASATPPSAPVEPIKAATPPTPPPPEPTTPAPAPQPEPQPEPPAPAVEPVSPPTPPSPPAAPVASQVLTPAPVPVSASTPQADLKETDQLRRIREIKADVNERVGNPVNLVDIDNTVGREYMNSLLEAMRAVSGGTPQGASAAMQRLESAYQSVVKVLDAHGGTSAAAPAPEPVSGYGAQTPSPQATAGQVEPEVSPVTPPVQPTPEPAVAPTPPAPQPEPAAPPTLPTQPVNPVVAPAPIPQAAEKETEEEKPSGWAQALAGIKLAVRSHDEPEDEAQKRPQVTPPAPVPQTPEPTPAPVPAPAPEPPAPVQSAGRVPVGVNAVKSLAQDPVPLRKPSDLPDKLPSQFQADHAGDPLYGSTIDEGLQQLLLEWSLFKKSGLFGTGPKGMEHPLFKQLAPLQIPLILAGRFEGATQEIKQSITDYMNGWRYEQGIVYESGETFEHYLRRVIHHILGGNDK